MTRLSAAFRAFVTALRTGTDPRTAAITRQLNAHDAFMYADRYEAGYRAGQDDAFEALTAELPHVIEQQLLAHGITPQRTASEYNDHMAARVVVDHFPAGKPRASHLSLVGGA